MAGQTVFSTDPGGDSLQHGCYGGHATLLMGMMNEAQVNENVGFVAELEMV